MASLRSELRYRFQYPIEYRLDLMKAWWHSEKFDAHAETIRFLIISDGLSFTSEQQFGVPPHLCENLR